MGKMKELEIRFRKFLQVANELKDLTKCLQDLGLFPFMIDRIEGKVLDKIENARARLPKFTKKECKIILEKHKAKIIELGICLCGGYIRKLSNEYYCVKCARVYYEE